VGPPPNASPQTLRVLALLLERPAAWHYGYEISRLTGLKSGTLYPILIRLAERGLLEARWAEPERPGRPPRHTYRLTTAGAHEAARATRAVTRRPAPLPRPEAAGG
jgi:PadR family transcriptional regulator PadR